MGLAALPAFLAREDLARGRLVRVLKELSFATGNLYFVYPQTEHVPRKVAAFRDFVLAYLAANPLVSGEPATAVVAEAEAEQERPRR
jgi:DNA-binding transcriptional LysR family regulator